MRDRLVEIVETIGVEELAVEMGFPGMLEHAVARHQIEWFADAVRPLGRASAQAAVA